MIYAVIATIAGLAGLVWSSDKFVLGSAAIARNLGMSAFMVGLTIVSLGTSAPEILVSINAAIDDSTELAVGNAIGSNIANIGLVLAITAFVVAIPIRDAQLKREIPLLLLITALGGWLLHDNHLSRLDGLVLLASMVVSFSLMIYLKSQSPEPFRETHPEDLPPKEPMGLALLHFSVGLVFLIASARLLVWGASEIALFYGVSKLIIGLTVVAIGTSLPELAATLTSALKGHHDIALGNILGSNLLNISAVMAISGVINPTQLEAEVFNRDYLSMAGITLLLTIIIFADYLHKRHQPSLGRFAALLILASYGLYYYWLFQT